MRGWAPPLEADLWLGENMGDTFAIVVTGPNSAHPDFPPYLSVWRHELLRALCLDVVTIRGDATHGAGTAGLEGGSVVANPPVPPL